MQRLISSPTVEEGLAVCDCAFALYVCPGPSPSSCFVPLYLSHNYRQICAKLFYNEYPDYIEVLNLLFLSFVIFSPPTFLTYFSLCSFFASWYE